jgi:hypothetical protein
VPPETDSVQYAYIPGDQAGSDVWIGFHEFRLVAVDDAGAKSNENIARFVVNYDPDTYIDSVWTFRSLPPIGGTPRGPALAEKLIYPSDSTRVVYHFGRLRIKFHGSDLDGAEPDTFRWNIKGTLIQSVNPADSKSPWVGEPSGDGYVDVTPNRAPYLDTDSPLTLFVRARDDKGKVDGSPDTVVFIVNYTPRIGTISHQVVASNRVKFSWICVDPDEDLDFGEVGLIRYKYRVDAEDWVAVTTKESSGLYRKYVEVTDLAPGPHVFKLTAYNGDYLLTRSDTKEYNFDLVY